MADHITALPLPESSLDLPVDLRNVVEKALEKDPAERYQTARELVVDRRRLTPAQRRSFSTVRRTVIRVIPCGRRINSLKLFNVWSFIPIRSSRSASCEWSSRRSTTGLPEKSRSLHERLSVSEVCLCRTWIRNLTIREARVRSVRLEI